MCLNKMLFFNFSVLLIAFTGCTLEGDIKQLYPLENVYERTDFAGCWLYEGYLDGLGTAARFSQPAGLAIDKEENIYVADSVNGCIRKITPAGMVTTLAGSRTSGYSDGLGTAARFCSPAGLALDNSGNIYVADEGNDCIRKITPAGMVTTLADNYGAVLQFISPISVAVDNAGNVYVMTRRSSDHYSISKITALGLKTTIVPEYLDHDLQHHLMLKVDSAGNVYFAKTNSICKINSAGQVTVLAGGDVAGYMDGMGIAAAFDNPNGLALDNSGNIYVADVGNEYIRKITPAGMVTTLRNSINLRPLYANAKDIAIDSAENLYGTDYNGIVKRTRIRRVVKNGK